MSDAESTPRELESYLQIWADVLSQALGEIAGTPMACAVLAQAPPDLPSASDSDLRIVAACSGALRGEMSFRMPPASAVRLAQILMSEPAAPAEANDQHREAGLELLRQVSSLAATALRAARGDVQFGLEPSASAPSWAASSSAWLQVGESSSPAALIEIQISAALLASLRAEKTETPAGTGGDSHPTPAAAEVPYDDKVNLNLLMDVELAVTLRFGSRQLLLREVLDLNPGSVIALDRQVHEPVDMLLDGRVIARGEVVVMDGNYGLRITEVAPTS